MAVVKNINENRILGNVNEYNKKYFYTVSILLFIICMLAGGLIVTIKIIFDHLNKHCSEPSLQQNLNTSAKLTSTNEYNTTLKIVNRSKWGAEPALQEKSLKTPVPYVIILHTTTRNCTNEQDCSFIVRHVQNGHMQTRKWWDIGYNFLIGDDGNIYEGRGWNFEGAFVSGYNSKSIGLAFIGNYNEYLPEEKAINAAKMLIEKGVQDGYIDKDYKLYGQRQFISTLSPGEMLYDNIKSWPHWTSKIV